jgi:hypothetical protein
MTGTLSPTGTSGRWVAVVDGARVWQLRRQHGRSPAEPTGKAGLGLSTMTRLEGQPSAALTPSQPSLTA